MKFRKRGADVRSAVERVIVREKEALKEASDRFEEGRAAYRILFTTGIDHYKEHGPPIQEWRQREGI